MPQSGHSEVYKTVDHLFRQEAGKMVAVLTRIFGFSNIEQAEDIVQDTLIKALEIWKWGKLPDNPQAWLYATAKNKAIDFIRREQLKYKIESDIAVLLKSEYSLAPIVNEMFTEGEIRDNQLRMMFACCHPVLSTEAQITLILKTLCGLSVREISEAFLTGEETISKRLYRTKEKIRKEKIALEYPGAGAMLSRTEAILKTLYLLFNEGYNSSNPETFIREELCEEAMRLTLLLLENSKTNQPQTSALLALMCYHASRFHSRVDDRGCVVLLQDQDRKQWNHYLIDKGNEYLAQSAEGDHVHELHLEASIASVHANATSFEATDWQLILTLYNALVNLTNNPIAMLNRCIVMGEVEGYEKAIIALKQMTGLSENFNYNLSLGELYKKQGSKTKARKYYARALGLTSSNVQKELIERKLNSL